MKLLSCLIIISSLLLIPSFASAQSTNTIRWDYLASTLTEVNAYKQQVFIDGTLRTETINCVQNAANVNCSVVVPALASGSHTVRVDALSGGITKSTSISGINPGNAPKDPSNFRYSIEVTINIGS